MDTITVAGADFGGAHTALTMIPSFMYILIERFILQGNTAVMGAR